LSPGEPALQNFYFTVEAGKPAK